MSNNFIFFAGSVQVTVKQAKINSLVVLQDLRVVSVGHVCR